jgi:hypothetical protein
MSNYNHVSNVNKVNETRKAKPTFKIKRISQPTTNKIDELTDKVDLLQRAVCHLTYLVAQNLEENRKAAILKRESWC